MLYHLILLLFYLRFSVYILIYKYFCFLLIKEKLKKKSLVQLLELMRIKKNGASTSFTSSSMCKVSFVFSSLLKSIKKGYSVWAYSGTHLRFTCYFGLLWACSGINNHLELSPYENWYWTWILVKSFVLCWALFLRHVLITCLNIVILLIRI